VTHVKDDSKSPLSECVSLQMYQCQCLSVSTDVSVSMSVSVPVFYTYAHLNIYTCVKFESDIDIPNLCV